MTFSDLTFSLLDDAQDGSLDELWFRLDGRIDHLLLDEFQDTAATQWRVLRRLAEEITSTMPPERTLFCVGDMKQSIYGWRHAEPRLLGQLPELLGGAVEARLAGGQITAEGRLELPHDGRPLDYQLQLVGRDLRRRQ